MSSAHSIAWSQRHIDALRSAQLPTARGGYRTEDVHRWIEHTAAAMRAGHQIQRPSAGTFGRNRLGTGYDVAHVDALVAAVAHWQDELLAATPQVAAPPETVSRRRRDVTLRWTDQQQDWVREAQFRSASGGHAYDEGDVDDFLDGVLAAMAAGKPLPAIGDALFHTKRMMQRGYAVEDVDDFLDQLERLRPVESD